MPHLSTQLDKSLKQGSLQEASDFWTRVSENVLFESVCDVEGHPVVLNKSFLGRANGKLVSNVPASIPTCKKGRDADYEPAAPLHSVPLRQQLRQLRRLQSLSRQLAAVVNGKSGHPETARAKCNELWIAILESTGFSGSFTSWLFDLGWGFIPIECPQLQDVQSLCSAVHDHYRRQERAFLSAARRKRQQDVRDDFRRGGRIAFGMIRDSFVDQPAVFRVHKTFRLKSTPIKKEGNFVVRIQDVQHLDCELPLYYNNVALPIVNVQNDKVTLGKALKRVSGIHELTQWRAVAEDEEKLHLSLRVWNQCWQRDDPEDDPQVLRDAAHVLRCLPDWKPYEGVPTSVETFQNALKKTSNRSMRGADKWSMKEVKALPVTLLHCLVDIFRYIEKEGNWPDTWVTAWVLFIPKEEEALGPESLRPITILSRLYRCWARCHALQVLQWATDNVAPRIGGGVRGVDPTLLMFDVQFQIENSTPRAPKGGLVIDITKAFNNVHRGLLIAIMNKLGLPDWIWKPYRGMMALFTRHLVLNHFISTGNFSSTGIPEGCPFAVLGMLFFTVAFWAYHREVVPGATTYAFADNWAAIVRRSDDLCLFARTLESFCVTMRLPISAKKCWIWATNRDMRRVARSVLLCGQAISVAQSERELGYDMQYYGQAKRVTFKKRVKKVISRLARIPAVPIAKKQKARLVRGAIVPAFAYGSETIHPSGEEIANLRTAVAKGIGCNRATENPYLALAVSRDPPLDPEFTLLEKKIAAIKRMNEVPHFPTKAFFQVANSPGPKHGPARALRDALGKWDLEILPEGVIPLKNGLKLDVLNLDLSTIRHYLIIEWGRVLCQRIKKKRKHIDIEYIDLPHQCQMARKRSDAEQGALLVHINGVAYTQDRLAKFLAESCDLCPFDCGEVDSIPHRLSCTALHPDRVDCVLNVRALQRMPAMTAWHAVGPIVDEVWKFWVQLQNWHLPPFENRLETPCTVFIDGSCTDMKNTLVRLSGFSVVRRTSAYKCEVVAEHIVPGIAQSSGRAEIMAGLVALELHMKVHIFSDYDTFVKRLRLLLRGCHVSLNWSNADLWRRIALLIAQPGSAVEVSKTKAHGQWQGLAEPQREHGWLNEVADSSAKRAVHEARPSLVKCMQRALKAQAGKRALVDTYQRYIAQVAEKRFNVQVKVVDPQEAYDLQPLHAEGPGIFLPIDRDRLAQVCAKTHWPVRFLELVTEYVALLQWNLARPAGCNHVS